MGKKPGMLFSPMVFAYWVVSAVAVVSYFSLAIRIATFVAERAEPTVGIVFGLLGGVLFGLITWPFVLASVWRGRRAYLRKSATPIVATVTEARHRVTRTENNPLSVHRVRLKVALTHPETGVEYWMKKEFPFNEFRRSTAKALLDRFPVGAEMPILVRGRTAGFDVRYRPQWVDLW